MSAALTFTTLAVATLLALPSPRAVASGGLLAPASDVLWPSLRARITIQTAAVSPLSLAGLAEGGQGLRGGAVLGDYVFAEPSFGSFRATSGVVFGSHAGAPQFSITAPGAASRLGLTLNQGRALPAVAQADGWQAAPYLGLGFSSPLGASGFSLSADLGWVAEAIAPGSDSLRTPLGVQGSDNQRRELRLSPLLQFGMRYTF
jgi:hypothetical protein